MFEIGRICVKTAGREAGRYCVVIDKSESGFVMVTGPRELTKVKRRKCNVTHLEPLLDKVKIAANATDSEVAKAFESSDLFSKLKLKKLSKDELKALETKKAEKAKKKEAIAAKIEKAKPKEVKAEPKPAEKPKAEPAPAEKK